jgi:hypothetical protein
MKRRRNLLSLKERETGIEPATSSLGKWMTIESKEQSRPWHAFLALEIAAFSPFEVWVPLNGAQMGHTVSSVPISLNIQRSPLAETGHRRPPVDL